MGVVRKIVNHIVDNVDPQISDATDHLPARFSGTFNDSTRNLTMTIESQGASAENLVATVNIPTGGGGSGGPTYSAGNGINITSENAIEIDTDVTATVAEVDTKVAKNQGTANAGKVLGIGSDGVVVPVDAGNSGTSDWIKINSFSNIDLSKVTVGTQILGSFSLPVGGSGNYCTACHFINCYDNQYRFAGSGGYLESTDISKTYNINEMRIHNDNVVIYHTASSNPYEYKSTVFPINNIVVQTVFIKY